MRLLPTIDGALNRRDRSSLFRLPFDLALLPEAIRYHVEATGDRLAIGVAMGFRSATIVVSQGKIVP